MAGVLITGFEPFGGETVNPSWEVVKQLDGMIIRGQQVVAKQLPCVFGEALTVLKAALETYQPRLTIAVGQAGGRVDITVERVAINVDDARIPDNKGQQPIDEPIVANGPAACFSTLPIKAIVSALRQQGIPASVSQTAGTFVCNHVMYGLLHQLQGKRGQKGGFIHIPYLPEQAAAHPGQASMSVATVREALETAIAVALEQDDDVKMCIRDSWRPGRPPEKELLHRQTAGPDFQRMIQPDDQHHADAGQRAPGDLAEDGNVGVNGVVHRSGGVE